MTMQEKGAIEIQGHDLRVAYGDFVALDIPELECRGRAIAVVGHNGSGKSTLIKTFLGLLPPRRGSVELYWRDNGDGEKLRPDTHMAFSPENGAVFEDISVESYVRLWSRIRHRDPNYYKNQGSDYIDLLNLAPLMPKLGRELSKGQRRRVQTAVGFLCRPRLFLFDEPFDGLDIQQANELAQIMVTEQQRMGILVSSHRMDIIERLVDYIIVLAHGNVVCGGTVPEVCAALGHQSVLITLDRNANHNLVDIVRALQADAPTFLVEQLGGQICLTGDDINLDRVKATLAAVNINRITFDVVEPTLIDAMNFHLKKLGNL